MKIDAVTVCVGYADFLATTIDRTLAAVDSLMVVTTSRDMDTRTLCCKYDFGPVPVYCHLTDDFYQNGMAFSLGAGLGVGVRAQAGPDNWVLVLDADIALPWHTRTVLAQADLYPFKLYGIDRATVVGRQMWDIVSEHEQFVSPILYPPPLRVSPRVCMPALGGYVPCGYFQLWNPSASGISDYPVHPAGTAEGSDMMHAARWSRSQRELLPELIGLHLETSPTGRPIPYANWRGRTTPAFV